MAGQLLVVEHEPDAGLSLMADHLGRHVQVVRPYRGEPLPAADVDPGYNGLIVLGGSMGALDDEVAPWLPATRRLLADAVRAGVPTLGICLGAQLLATACGGTVERGADGLELGVVPVKPLPEAGSDPFFGGLQRAVAADAWPVLQYHYDAVTRLPPDAELIVTGERYPHQGFRVGAAAWGVQYHPEVSTHLFSEWVTGGLRRGELTADAAVALGPFGADSTGQSRIAAVHAQAFLDVVAVRQLA
jgi:GMP synthase-like glutamine amidotransferase